MRLVEQIDKIRIEKGHTEQDLLKEIGMKQARYNRWKNNKEFKSPDPRTKEGRTTYRDIAKYINVSEEKAILLGIYTEDGLKLTALSSQLKSEHTLFSNSSLAKKIYSIGSNLVGCEELVDTVIELIRSYKINIKKEKWIE